MIKYLRYQNLWIGILISISSFFLFDFLRWEEYDMRSFIDGSKLLFGDETALNLQSRITKPLPLILPGLLHLLLNFDIKQTILFQNCILLLISLITILKIETYYKSNNLMPLIVLSGPFAIFALFIQSDIWHRSGRKWCFAHDDCNDYSPMAGNGETHPRSSPGYP